MKPCPFCGSRKLGDGGYKDQTDHGPVSSVNCQNCDSDGPNVCYPIEDDRILDDAWNTRGAMPIELSFIFRGFTFPWGVSNDKGNVIAVKHRPKGALKCPFCSSDDLELDDCGSENDHAWYVHCRNCDASGPQLKGHHDTKELATSRWNTRTGRIRIKQK